MSDNTAVAVLCRPSGALVEVVYDELGLHRPLTPGRHFSSIIAPHNALKAKRFLRTIRASRSALDWELALTLPHGVVTLFFSGAVGPQGIVIIGAKEPFTASALSNALAGVVEKNPEAMEPAIGQLLIRTEEKAKSAQKVEQQIMMLNDALAARPEDSTLGAGDRKSRSRHLRLLEIAAHDLRNPIGAVLAATQYLAEDAVRVLEPDHITLLRSIESSCQTMLRHLQDMVEIPAIGSGGGRLDLQRTDTGSLVEHAVAANRPLAENRKVTIEISVHKPLPALAADPVKLSQALDGLLSNAIRSSHVGGRIAVEAGAQSDSVVITFRYKATRGYNLRSLLDQSHANRPQRRLSGERAALMLAQVRRIVAAHHGTIQFGADASEESTVIVTLPISRQAKPRPPGTKRDRGTHPAR